MKERKLGQRTGQDTKHNHNGILPMTTSTVPATKSLTCGFQHREQEPIWIYLHQNYILEEGERNRKHEKEPDIEEIADKFINLPNLDGHPEKSDKQVLGDFQGDWELEEGSIGETEHEEGEFASEPMRRASARNRRPRILYTYDTLDEPTLRPLNCLWGKH